MRNTTPLGSVARLALTVSAMIAAATDPAEINGKRVSQKVRAPFTFGLAR